MKTVLLEELGNASTDDVNFNSQELQKFKRLWKR